MPLGKGLLTLGTEEAVGRYLDVFLPFIATIACAHLIARQSGSPLLAGLADPSTFRRALVATAVAAVLIIGVDLATDGELFLRPRFPESQLLIALLLVALGITFTIARSLASLARHFKRTA